MSSNFSGSRFTLKKQKVALTGTYRVFDENNQLVGYCKKKAMKLKEDIRVFADEKQSEEIMMIKARSIMDTAGTYDVFDSKTNAPIGALRRKGWKSMSRDTWEILDTAGQVEGTLIEDSAVKAFLRRALLGSLLPQSFDLDYKGQLAMNLKQKFGAGYTLEIAFHNGADQGMDHRLGIAAGLLLAVIEGKQD